MNRVLVSIIIPCFNQAGFLKSAIESSLAQSYGPIEIIVVDDGSTDDTRKVADRYSGIRYVRQANKGLAAARNTGFRESHGNYLIFLDADDRLLPHAVEVGLKYIKDNKELAFVWGRYRLLWPDETVNEPFRNQEPHEVGYHSLLRGNCIAMHATVLYRRETLRVIGGFDTSLPACEDYDLYLRIARQHQIAHHDQVIAEYRRHDTNMSYNSPLMLKTVLTVLRSQWQYIETNVQYRNAYRVGIGFWKEFYGLRSIRRIISEMASGQRQQAWEDTKSLVSSVGGMQIVLFLPLWLIKHLVRESRSGNYR